MTRWDLRNPKHFIGTVLLVAVVTALGCQKAETPSPQTTPPPAKTMAHDPNDDDLVLVDAAGNVSKEIVCINLGGQTGKKKNVLWVSTKTGGQLELKSFY